MPLIDTDRWWRKNAVTARAKIAEILKQGKPNGKGFVTQTLSADIVDPATGEVTRAQSDIFSFGGHVAGEEMAVRWSAERRQFREFSQANAPEEEWLQFVNGQGPAAQAANEPTRMVTHTVNLVNATGTDPGEATAQLEALRAQGALTDEQFEQIRGSLEGGRQ